jgi:RNA polymerase sigma-70 factor, ECF subfamily
VSTVTCGVGVEETSGSWPVLAEELNPGGKMRLSDDAVAAELFAAHYGRLAGWCRRLLDDDQTASEVAMEAFTRLLGRLRKVDDPVGYLYVIAANLVRDHWRKTKREREGMRVLQQERPSEHGSGDPELRSLVEQLPEKLRTPVLLYYYAGFPIGDIARLTNRPTGTVKSDLFQARAVLRKALEGTR